MIVCDTPRAGHAVLQQWRRQIAYYRRCPERAPLNLIALVYLAHGSAPDGLLDLQQLTVCVLHDSPNLSGHVSIRFAGYKASVVPHGIALGGAQRMRFEKDLALPPQRYARGLHFSLDRSELLGLALQMERRLRRHARYPFLPRCNSPRLPQFFVALALDDPLGDGPEFAAYCRQTGCQPKRPLVEWHRDHLGQALYPVEFVGHLWQRFRKVYVHMRTLRRSQMVRMKRLDELVGFQGACRYDFLHSRFKAAAAA